MSLVEPWNEACTACWSGATGSGKTYKAFNLILKWLRCGLPVITNIDILALPREPLTRWGDDYTPIFDPEDDPGSMSSNDVGQRIIQRIKAVTERRPGAHVLIVVDECSLVFSAANWKAMPDEMKAFLVQHRKLNCSMVAIAQSVAMIDVSIRRIAQEFTYHRNMCKDPVLGQIIWLFTTNWHKQWSCATIDGKPMHPPHSRTFFTIDPKVASCYNSGQLHSFKTAEKPFKRPRKRLVRWSILAVLVLVVGVGGVGTIKGVAGVLDRLGSKSEKGAVAAAGPLDDDLILRRPGRVLSIWDELQGGLTVYEVEFETGIEEVRLRTERWGAERNQHLVGEKLEFVLPAPQTGNLGKSVELALKQSK